jgi:hypothetical protein
MTGGSCEAARPGSSGSVGTRVTSRIGVGHSVRSLLPVAAATLACVPWIVLAPQPAVETPLVLAAASGLAILGAAFLLSDGRLAGAGPGDAGTHCRVARVRGGCGLCLSGRPGSSRSAGWLRRRQHDWRQSPVDRSGWSLVVLIAWLRRGSHCHRPSALLIPAWYSRLATYSSRPRYHSRPADVRAWPPGGATCVTICLDPQFRRRPGVVPHLDGQTKARPTRPAQDRSPATGP